MAWPSWGGQAIGVGVSTVAAVGTGVVTNVVTDQPSVPWVAAFVVLVVVMVVAQVWLTVAQRRPAGRSHGAGSVSVDGSSYEPISTRVTGVRSRVDVPADGGEHRGPGAVVIGGDARGRIDTDVDDVRER